MVIEVVFFSFSRFFSLCSCHHAPQVASMKRLLEEKNAALDRMKLKLEHARAESRGAAEADRSEAARLTDRHVLRVQTKQHETEVNDSVCSAVFCFSLLRCVVLGRVVFCSPSILFFHCGSWRS